MGFEVLTQSEMNSILKKVGESLKRLMRKRIQDQKEVDGGSFPRLASSTIKSKQAKGGGISGNANKRMVATGDFLRHAYEYVVNGSKVTFGISSQPHMATKTEEKRQRELKRKKKPSNFSQHKNYSYRDLAGWQIAKKSPYSKGSFPKKGINSNNPGADFFGINAKESDELFKMMSKEVGSSARRSIEKQLNNIIANARR